MCVQKKKNIQEKKKKKKTTPDYMYVTFEFRIDMSKLSIYVSILEVGNSCLQRVIGVF